MTLTCTHAAIVVRPLTALKRKDHRQLRHTCTMLMHGGGPWARHCVWHCECIGQWNGMIEGVGAAR